MNLSDREKIKKFLRRYPIQRYSMCDGTVKLKCSEMKQIVEWLTELGERCGVVSSHFTVGGWVLFYRDDIPLSVYRVIDISDSRIRLSGWACFDIHGKHYNDDFGCRFTYIRPIDANTAMKYVEKGLYIMDEDKDILLCEIESTTI